MKNSALLRLYIIEQATTREDLDLNQLRGAGGVDGGRWDSVARCYLEEIEHLAAGRWTTAPRRRRGRGRMLRPRPPCARLPRSAVRPRPSHRCLPCPPAARRTRRRGIGRAERGPHLARWAWAGKLFRPGVCGKLLALLGWAHGPVGPAHMFRSTCRLNKNKNDPKISD